MLLNSGKSTTKYSTGQRIPLYNIDLPAYYLSTILDIDKIFDIKS